mgnify:CR=1 FL=1
MVMILTASARRRAFANSTASGLMIAIMAPIPTPVMTRHAPNSVTEFGKFLDPLADKVFNLVTLIALLQLPGPRIPVWLVSIVIIREVAVTGLRAIAASGGVVIAAGDSGKVKTTFGTLGTAGLLMHYTYLVDWGFAVTPVSLHRLGLALTYISLLYSFSNFFDQHWTCAEYNHF